MTTACGNLVSLIRRDRRRRIVGGTDIAWPHRVAPSTTIQLNKPNGTGECIVSLKPERALHELKAVSRMLAPRKQITRRRDGAPQRAGARSAGERAQGQARGLPEDLIVAARETRRTQVVGFGLPTAARSPPKCMRRTPPSASARPWSRISESSRCCGRAAARSPQAQWLARPRALAKTDLTVGGLGQHQCAAVCRSVCGSPYWSQAPFFR